ncbi:hypothetical protein [Bartonella vinsonii]|uniref:Putative membrane protein n=1 Tax=Bartonella vinsonii subsp. berkhoffii str. Tweed TaxID=1094502 RepID=N6VGP9_BARVB|nr:hypothetical protein [Bartonella vinsonii]AGF76382.1 putative membrane protein [Bartonella vinsonii subsp. berkhoffii str. Winnie]ENN92930.1 putative membrane protein [Bartonella vinsonii subsp. berkhoffii str. Tweed]
MNIRYFFIAGAITAGLALAIQESDRIVNQEKAPIVTPYTVDEFDQDDLNLLEPASGTFEKSDILLVDSNYGARNRYEEDLYTKGKKLLDALVGFLCSVITFFINKLFATH